MSPFDRGYFVGIGGNNRDFYSFRNESLQAEYIKGYDRGMLINEINEKKGGKK